MCWPSDVLTPGSGATLPLPVDASSQWIQDGGIDGKMKINCIMRKTLTLFLLLQIARITTSTIKIISPEIGMQWS